LAAIVLVLIAAAALNIFAVFFMMPTSEIQLSGPYKIPPIERTAESLSAIPVDENTSRQSDADSLVNLPGKTPPEEPIANETNALAMIDTPSESGPPHVTAGDEPVERSPETAPPHVLGQLIVRPGDTLGIMINQVYGVFRKSFLSMVIAANPHITDPNDIEVGNIVQFPTVNFELNRQSPPIFIIAFDEQLSLSAAMQRLRVLFEEIQLPVRVLPTWSPGDGLRFHLVLKGYFNSHDAASRYLSLLPAQTSDQASIVFEWSDKTLLFSDPYGGGLRLSPLTVRNKIEE
jgi:hypothetical protein